MKIKTLLAVVILSVAALTRVHAFGLGVQANLYTGSLFAPGAALVVSPSDMINIAGNWYLGNDKVNIIGLTLDVCPLNLPIVSFSAGSLNFTLGAGVFANMVFDEDPGFNGGIRVPIGFSLLLGQKAFEIFTHVAPSFGVNFLPSLGLGRPFFPVALGVKIWFR